MFKAFLSAFFLVLSIGLNAQDARLLLSEARHDFGSIPPGSPVTHGFMVRNVSDAPLSILKLLPSCGCTSAKGAPVVLPPGGQAVLDVTLDPQGFQGRVLKEVRVFTDRGELHPILLTVTAEVIPQVVASANQILFDDVPRDGGGRAEVRLDSRTSQGVEVAELHAPPYLEVHTRRDGSSLVLELALDGAKVPSDRGRGADVLRVDTRHPKAGPISIQVFWTMAPMPR